MAAVDVETLVAAREARIDAEIRKMEHEPQTEEAKTVAPYESRLEFWRTQLSRCTKAAQTAMCTKAVARAEARVAAEREAFRVREAARKEACKPHPDMNPTVLAHNYVWEMTVAHANNTNDGTAVRRAEAVRRVVIHEDNERFVARRKERDAALGIGQGPYEPSYSFAPRIVYELLPPLPAPALAPAQPAEPVELVKAAEAAPVESVEPVKAVEAAAAKEKEAAPAPAPAPESAESAEPAEPVKATVKGKEAAVQVAAPAEPLASDTALALPPLKAWLGVTLRDALVRRLPSVSAAPPPKRARCITAT